MPAQIFAAPDRSAPLGCPFHRVQNSLRSRFGSHPDFDAAGALQTPHRVARHQIAAGLHLERNRARSRCSTASANSASTRRKVRRCRRQTRYGPAQAVSSDSSISSATRRAERHVIAVAVNRLRAPVAAKRATAARHHVQRKIAVCASHALRYGVHVDQIPCGQRELIQIRSRTRAARVMRSSAVAVRICQSVDAPGGVPAARAPAASLPLRRSAHNRIRPSDIRRHDRTHRIRAPQLGIPCSRAASAIQNASSRLRVRHILLRKVEIVFANHHQPGRHVESAFETLCSGASSVTSQTSTARPRLRSTAAASNVCSGGYGCIFSTCFVVKDMIAVCEQNVHCLFRSSSTCFAADYRLERLAGEQRPAHHQPLLRHRNPQLQRVNRRNDASKTPVKRLLHKRTPRSASTRESRLPRVLFSWFASRKYRHAAPKLHAVACS